MTVRCQASVVLNFLVFLKWKIFLLGLGGVDGRINYQCLDNEVLIVNARNSDRIQMRCSRPNICLDRLECKYDESTTKLTHCGGRRNFVAGIFQRSAENQIEHKCCETATVNPNHVGNECFTHKLLDRFSKAYTINGSSIEKEKLRPAISFSMDADERNARPYHLKLLPLHAATPPVFLVKGLAKIPGGYQVTFCIIACNLFASKNKNRPPSTSRPTIPSMIITGGSETPDSTGGATSNEVSRPDGRSGNTGNSGASGESGKTGFGGVTGSGDATEKPDFGGENGNTGSGGEQESTGSGGENGNTGSGIENGNTGSGIENGNTGSGGENENAGFGGTDNTGSGGAGNTGFGMIENGNMGSGGQTANTGSGRENEETGGGNGIATSETETHPGTNSGGSPGTNTGSEPGSGSGNSVQTGSTNDPSFRAPPPFPNSLFANIMSVARRNCFSGDMTVETPEGTVNMESLEIGQQILVAKGAGTLVYEPIEWFYHKEPNETALFLHLQTESGKILSLTPGHLIIFSESCSETLPSSFYEFNKDFSLFASKIKVGNCIPTKNGGKISWDRVTKIERKFKNGIYSPMTATGTVVVNDVHVSCFSHFESHGVQQLVYRLLKAQWRLGSAIQRYFYGDIKSSKSSVSQGIPKMVQFVIPLAQCASEYHML